jgi:hypothetical protein
MQSGEENGTGGDRGTDGPSKLTLNESRWRRIRVVRGWLQQRVPGASKAKERNFHSGQPGVERPGPRGWWSVHPCNHATTEKPDLMNWIVCLRCSNSCCQRGGPSVSPSALLTLPQSSMLVVDLGAFLARERDVQYLRSPPQFVIVLDVVPPKSSQYSLSFSLAGGVSPLSNVQAAERDPNQLSL